MTEVRPCSSVDELRDALFGIGHYLGRERPDDAWTERWLKNFELERMLAAFDGAAIVGGAGAFTCRLSVPGAVVPTAGVTVVGVLPTHRRRGILRELMRAQLDDVHSRGEPVAALFASEETIYGRFGYGLASKCLELKIARDRSGYRPDVSTVGSTRLVSQDDALELLPPVYERLWRETPGMLERPRSWWEHRFLPDPEELRFGGGPKQYAVLEVDGAVAGYALYRLRTSFGDLGPETTVQAIEAVGVDGAATASIWRFLLDIDWVRTISARLLPVDHPLLLLLARPNFARPTVQDALWVRLVDVGEALDARGYADDGRIVFEVRDAFCPWNEGRWALEGGSAARTDGAADLALDVPDLASAYLGGFTFRQLARAGRVEERTPGALAAADAMFRTDVAPWSPEIF